MKTFNVVVRRVVREDILITVQAENAEQAVTNAELEATSRPQEQWDTYDCDYSSDPAKEAVSNADA